MATKTATKRVARKTKAKVVPTAKPEPKVKAPRKPKLYVLPTHNGRDEILDRMAVVKDNVRLLLHYEFQDELKNLAKTCTAIEKLKTNDKSTAKAVKAYNEAITQVQLDLASLAHSMELITSKDEPSGLGRDDPDFKDPDDE